MDEFLLFVRHYWRELAALVGFLISLVINIILLIKKKASFDVYTKAINQVLVDIPGFISVAEGSGLSGAKKKLMVVNMALQDLSDTFGRSLSEDEANYLSCFVNRYIEMVLCTPQKKEGEK